MFIKQVRRVFMFSERARVRGCLGRGAGVHRVSLAADRDCRHNEHAQAHQETGVEVDTGELPSAAKNRLLAQHLRRA